jgi:hypothetical protein
MRTALLAADRLTPQGALRAGLRLAGRSVLGWQAALAQELGCERVVVLSEAADQALAEAERACRAQGIAFHRLTSFAGLAALLHADDDLLLLGDGVLPDGAALARLLAPQGPTRGLRKLVLCLPGDAPQAQAHPEDFERIDAARCWAGVAVLRAAPVQRLGDFPPDSNPVSLLLRMALQAGTPGHTLSADEIAGGWLLAHDEAVLAARQHARIARARRPARWSAPGLALAESLAARLARDGRAGVPAAAGLAGLALLLGAALLAAAGWERSALAGAVLGSGALDLAAANARITSALLGERPARLWQRLHDPGRDVLAALVLIAALGLAAAPGSGHAGALAALGPLALAAARLAARGAADMAAAFWQDRSAQLALLALGAGLGVLADAAALLALGACAQALLARPAPPIPE